MAKCNVGFANIEVHTKSGAKNKKANDIWRQPMKKNDTGNSVGSVHLLAQPS